MSDKILILTSVNKLNGGVGQIYLDRLVQHLDNPTINRYLPVTNIFKGYIGKAVTKLFLISKILGVIELLIDMIRILYMLVKIDKNKKILVTLSSRLLIRSSFFILYFKPKCKLSVIVWDHPAYIFYYNTKRYEWVNYLDKKIYSHVLKNCKFAITMGKKMDDELFKISHSTIKTLHIKSALQKNNIKLEKKKNDKGVYKIIFAGSIYSKDCWNSLLTSIDELNLNESINVKLYHFGNYPITGVRKSKNLSILGYIDPEEIKNKLKDYDFGYVPYSFDKNFSLAAKTSFAGKINDYVFAGLPIFYHGPDDGEVSESIKRHNAGFICDSINVNMIKKVMLKNLEKQDVYRSNLQSFYDNELLLKKNILLNMIMNNE